MEKRCEKGVLGVDGSKSRGYNHPPFSGETLETNTLMDVI